MGDGLVNSIMHLEMVWDSLRNDLYDAGIDHSSMRQLTDWRCIDALLADRLSRSTIASRLNFVSVNGVQHLDQGVCMTDMVKIRNKKLASLLTKVAQ